MNDLTNFPGADQVYIDDIYADIEMIITEDPTFSLTFLNIMKRAIESRFPDEPPYERNHFRAALNRFMNNYFDIPNLLLPFPQNVDSAEGNAGAASAVGGRRKRATRKQRKTKKHLKRKVRKVCKTQK